MFLIIFISIFAIGSILALFIAAIIEAESERNFIKEIEAAHEHFYQTSRIYKQITHK